MRDRTKDLSAAAAHYAHECSKLRSDRDELLAALRESQAVLVGVNDTSMALDIENSVRNNAVILAKHKERA